MSGLFFRDANQELQILTLPKAQVWFIIEQTQETFREHFGEDVAEMWEINFTTTKYVNLDTVKRMSEQEYNQACEIIFKACEGQPFLAELQNALTQDQRYLQKEPA